jgi:acyl dehydratase
MGSEGPEDLLAGIPVGDTERSRGRTVGEGEAALLHTLLWSLGRLHTEEPAARAAGFERPNIAGPVLAGLVTGLWVTGTTQIERLEREHGVRLLAELGSENRYRSPAFYGDTLSVACRLDAVRASQSRPGQGIATFLLTGTNQRGDVVAEVRSQVLFERVAAAQQPSSRSRIGWTSAR